MSIQHVNLSMNTTASALNTTYGLAAMNDSRVQIESDGTIHLAEKPVAYVIGEHIAPVIDSVIPMAKGVFYFLGEVFSSKRYDGSRVLPGESDLKTRLTTLDKFYCADLLWKQELCRKSF